MTTGLLFRKIFEYNAQIKTPSDIDFFRLLTLNVTSTLKTEKIYIPLF